MKIVVSEWAMITPFGHGPEVFLDGLAAGRSAAGPIHSFDARGIGPAIAAQVPPLPDSPRDRKIGLVRRAGASLSRVRSNAWIHLGVGLEAAHLEDFYRVDRPDALRTPLDAAPWSLAEILHTTGPVTIDTSACAAGGLSLLTGLQLLREGLADQVVVGGVDAMVNPLGYGGMERLGALSPSGRARPFDRRRDGLLMGEGVALFVLERESPQTPVLGRLLGGASTQDGYRVTAPRPDGSRAQVAIERALQDAGNPTIDWVNAHGTGTPLNDPAEVRALHNAGLRVPIRSIKGAIGHAMAASGALEAAATWLCLSNGLLPGTFGFSESEPATAGEHSALPRPSDARTALSTSFGFGGQNVALVLGAP